MRTLNAKEQRRVAGGLMQNRMAASPLFGPPTRFPPAPDSGTVKLTPLFNNLGQTDGLTTQWGSINKLSISQKSVSYQTDLLGGVDMQLMHELGSSTTTLSATMPNVNGSDVNATASFGSNGSLSGNIKVGANGDYATIGVNSSGDILGGGGFNVDSGEFTGKASFDFSNDTLSVSGSLFNFGPVECDFDVFGLGSGGGGGASLTCFGTPTVQQEVAGPRVLDHAYSNQPPNSAQHAVIA